MQLSEGRERNVRIIEKQELVIFHTISQFWNNGIPLDRSGVRDLAKTR